MSNEFANLDIPSVQAQVNPSTATLGDLITLSIRVTHPQALQIDPPAFAEATAGSPAIPLGAAGKPALGTFEIYASTRLASQINGDKAVDQFQAALQNFTTGPQLLSGLEVPYRDPMGNVHSVKTPDLTVTITELPPGPKDKGNIRGIKGVIGPTAWSPWWWLLAVMALSAIGYVLWRRRKRALAGPPPSPPIPADIVAMEKLQKLAQTDWLAAGKIKEYYSAISDILREYLEKGFAVSALERTTSELMRDLRKKPEIAMEHQTELRDLLEMADLVKFAKYRPSTEEAMQMHQAGVRFVEQTREAQPHPDLSAGASGHPSPDGRGAPKAGVRRP